MIDERFPVFLFDNIRVDPQIFKVFRAGSEVQIEPKAFTILLFLLEHRGKLIEKNEILDAVWKDTNVTENALTREIAKLRKLLGDDPKQARYIQTVHTRGYRFIAAVQVKNGELKNGPQLFQAVAGEEQQHDFARASEASSLSANSFGQQNGFHAVSETTTDSKSKARRRLSRKTFVSVSLAAFVLLAGIAYAGWSFLPYLPFSTVVVQEIVPVTTSPGLSLDPTFSPDGNTVAYSSAQGGGVELYAKPLVSGGREIQLTADGNRNLEPAWSPDGKFIAYHSAKRGGIWLIPALGGAARQLTEFGCHPAWSRDGQRLAFQSESMHDLIQPFASSATIWIVSAEGGALRQITQAGKPAGGHLFPTWSPDGKHLAFLDGNQASMQIWSIAVTGEQLTLVTQRQAFTKADLVWAPDGESIFYAMGTMLLRQHVAPDSGAPIGKPARVADLGATILRSPTLSADGKRVAYSAWTAKSNLRSIPISPDSNAATGAPVALTNEVNSRNGLPSFSPDGQKIAFVSERRGDGYQLWLMAANGGSPMQLTTAPDQAFSPVWYPDGKQIAFQSFRAGRVTLSSISVEDRKEKQLSEAAGMVLLRLSPDGKHVAFTYSPDGFSNVGVMSAEDGKPQPLTFEKTFTGFPCWSPDGEFIAYQAKRGDYSQMMLLPRAGGTPVQLTFDQGDNWPFGWSPDGDKIAVARTRAGIWNIWWVSRSTGVQQQLTRNSQAGTLMRFPAWSPLGNQIVYEHVELTGNIYVMGLK